MMSHECSWANLADGRLRPVVSILSFQSHASEIPSG